MPPSVDVSILILVPLVLCKKFKNTLVVLVILVIVKIDNPVNEKGFETHYLWEETLQPNCLLDLIENFVHIRTESEKVYDPQRQKVVEKKTDVLIFPRFHQLSVVQKMKNSIIDEGVGNN